MCCQLKLGPQAQHYITYTSHEHLFYKITTKMQHKLINSTEPVTITTDGKNKYHNRTIIIDLRWSECHTHITLPIVLERIAHRSITVVRYGYVCDSAVDARPARRAAANISRWLWYARCTVLTRWTVTCRNLVLAVITCETLNTNHSPRYNKKPDCMLIILIVHYVGWGVVCSCTH